MKLVHTARHPTEAHLIKGMLEAEGVRASVLGDQLYGAYGELPVLPTVWVLDDTLALHADSLIVDFLRGGPARRYGHERWTCPQSHLQHYRISAGADWRSQWKHAYAAHA